jgi:serine phosphatase RsbU (regulator of sigma subunit)
MKIGVKITAAFFLVAFVSMLVIGFISYNRAKDALEKQSFDKLTAVREMKAEQIEDYFQLISDQITTSAKDPLMINAMKDLKKGYNSIRADLKVTDEELRQTQIKVDKYISEEYLPRLDKNLTGRAELNTEVSHKTECVLLQNLFYASNPNKTGEKFKLMQADDSSSYSKAHLKYHPTIAEFLEKFGYYDVFLIDNETGNIVYTVYKEVDFGTSLVDGPFKNTNLAAAYKAAAEAGDPDFVNQVDFMPYHPSYNESASFIASPIFDGNKKIGVLAFQMPIDKINDIMTNRQHWANVGLGKTGETYIVGEDYKIRNQSRFLIEDSINYFKMLRDIKVDDKIIDEIKNFKSTVGLQEVRTEGSEAALKGMTDARIFPDYRGVPVLSAFKPLNILNMHWVLMSEIDEAEAFEQVTTLRNSIIIGFICLLVLVFGLSYVVSHQMTKPLKELTVDALELAKGNMDVEIKTGGKDEIGILSVSFKKMQSSISKLITDLRNINHNLEEKVMERTAEVVKQKDIIEEKQKEVLESIHYAKRIQTTILAHDEYLTKNLSDHFVLFKPKDIVSGDFYWATRKIKAGSPTSPGVRGEKVKPTGEINSELFYVAVCDSTGHGVPGAFMSLLNISFLNEGINEKNIDEPNEVLNHVRARLIKNISHDGAQDGMDGVLLCIDKMKNKVTYSAAHNCPILIRDKELIEFEADKMPIGKGIKTDPFQLHEIKVKKGDIVYMYTDGYADQFGGPKGKKFKYRTLNNLLLEISDKPLSEQRHILNSTFDTWRGDLEQVDDVCVVAIQF